MVIEYSSCNKLQSIKFCETLTMNLTQKMEKSKVFLKFTKHAYFWLCYKIAYSIKILRIIIYFKSWHIHFWPLIFTTLKYSIPIIHERSCGGEVYNVHMKSCPIWLSPWKANYSAIWKKWNRKLHGIVVANSLLTLTMLWFWI